MVEFVDFKCEKCEAQFWVETKKGNIQNTVEQTVKEKCPSCQKSGGVKRIPAPDRYLI